MVQNNCIDMNTWYSRVDKPERPDHVVFDLDPPDGGFALGVRVGAPRARGARRARPALVRRRLAARTASTSSCRSTRRSSFEDTHAFAEAVVEALAAEHQGLVTTEWLKRKREGVFVDFHQNGMGRTMSSVVLGAARSRARRCRRRCAGRSSTRSVDRRALHDGRRAASGSSGTATCWSRCCAAARRSAPRWRGCAPRRTTRRHGRAADPLRAARARLHVAGLHATPCSAAGAPRRPRSWASRCRRAGPQRHEGFLRLRLGQMRRDPSAQPWLARALTLRGDEERPFVGFAGFHGPPGVNALQRDGRGRARLLRRAGAAAARLRERDRAGAHALGAARSRASARSSPRSRRTTSPPSRSCASSASATSASTGTRRTAASWSSCSRSDARARRGRLGTWRTRSGSGRRRRSSARRSRTATRRCAISTLHVHALVRETLPDVEFTIDLKDGMMGYGARQYGADGWGIAALACHTRWVTLAFMRGSGLPDPAGVLEGTGKSVRHVKVHSQEQLAERAPSDPRAARGRRRTLSSGTPAARPELGDPGGRAQAHPERRQQHVEDDDRGARGSRTRAPTSAWARSPCACATRAGSRRRPGRPRGRVLRALLDEADDPVRRLLDRQLRDVDDRAAEAPVRCARPRRAPRRSRRARA